MLQMEIFKCLCKPLDNRELAAGVALDIKDIVVFTKKGHEAASLAYVALVRILKAALRNAVDDGLDDAIRAVGSSALFLLSSFSKSPEPVSVSQLHNIVDPLHDVIIAGADRRQGRLPAPLRQLMVEFLLEHVCVGFQTCIASRLSDLHQARHVFISHHSTSQPIDDASVASINEALKLFDEAIQDLHATSVMALRCLLLMADCHGDSGGRVVDASTPHPPGLSQRPSVQHQQASSSPAVDGSSEDSQPGVTTDGRGRVSFKTLCRMDETGAVELLKAIGDCLTTVIKLHMDSSSTEEKSTKAAVTIRNTIKKGVDNLFQELVDPTFCCIERLVALGAGSAAAESSSAVDLMLQPCLASNWCYRILCCTGSLVTSIVDWVAANDSLLPQLGSIDAAPAGGVSHRSSLLLQHLFGSLLVYAKELTASALSLESMLPSQQAAEKDHDGLETLLERVEEEASGAAIAVARLTAIDIPAGTTATTKSGGGVAKSLLGGGMRQKRLSAQGAVSSPDKEQAVAAVHGGMEGLLRVAHALGVAAQDMMMRVKDEPEGLPE